MWMGRRNGKLLVRLIGGVSSSLLYVCHNSRLGGPFPTMLDFYILDVKKEMKLLGMSTDCEAVIAVPLPLEAHLLTLPP